MTKTEPLPLYETTQVGLAEVVLREVRPNPKRRPCYIVELRPSEPDSDGEYRGTQQIVNTEHKWQAEGVYGKCVRILYLACRKETDNG